MSLNNNQKQFVKPISSDKYNNYLLSRNICEFLKEKNIEQVDKNSLFTLTNVIKGFIENLAIKAKGNAEISGRVEANLIDLFFSLNDFNITQSSIFESIKNNIPPKNAFDEAIQNQKEENKINSKAIEKLNSLEEFKRLNLLKKLNAYNLPLSKEVNFNFIPKCLRFFPRDFTMANTEEDNINNKAKDEIKFIEKKNIEDIISSIDYYDRPNKKNENYFDSLSLYKDIIKNYANEESTGNPSFFKRFKIEDKDIKQKYINKQNVSDEKSINNNKIKIENIDSFSDKPMDID